MMNSITFQVSGIKEVEPELFIYGIIVESSEIATTLRRIAEIVDHSDLIEEVLLQNMDYTLPVNENDLKSIKVFKIHSRQVLTAFTSDLRKLEKVKGGIIRSEISNPENHDFSLIQELTEKAKVKAEKYAQLCNKKIQGIVSFKVIDSNKGRWSAYPPIKSLDKSNIYYSILRNYDRKDRYEISRTLEVEFEMK